MGEMIADLKVESDTGKTVDDIVKTGSLPILSFRGSGGQGTV